MSTWQALEPFLLSLRREGREAFLRKHPEPVFIFKPPDEDEDEDLTDTHTLTSSRVELVEKLSREEINRLARAQGFRVVIIVPSGFDSDGDAVTIGRSKTCDLVLRHTTISKEHALIRKHSDGRVCLRDQGSRNGTRLNGAKLQREWEPTLESGDRVTFGNFTVTFQTADAFCDFLEVVLEGH